MFKQKSAYLIRQTGIDNEVIASARRWLSTALSGLPMRVDVDFLGEQFCIDNAGGNGQHLKVEITDQSVLRDLLLSKDPLNFVESYLNGQVNLTGDLDQLILLVSHLSQHVEQMPGVTLKIWLDSKLWPSRRSSLRSINLWHRLFQHSPERDKIAIQEHYDLGNEFFSLWLDPHLVYSCAHFETAEMNLAAAQEAKLDLICKKLRLRPGESFLDIGCGWGGLLRWAVTHYGVKGCGITLSEKQLAYNRKWISELGLEHSAKVELRDYRHLPAQQKFDKIASVGMVEHVGPKNYPRYFANILAVLSPGGLFLNHGITTNDKFSHLKLAERFINRYIFPDGELSTLPEMLNPAKEAGWEIVDVDCWRPHYAKTLRCWAENLASVKDKAEAIVGSRNVRLWQIYLSGSAMGFADNHLTIYQTLLRRKQEEKWDLPMTRSGWLC